MGLVVHHLGAEVRELAASCESRHGLEISFPFCTYVGRERERVFRRPAVWYRCREVGGK
jgi:hypothetical protein